MTVQLPLADLAFVRCGDKGDISDVGLFVDDRPAYDLVVAQVTAARVAALLDGWVTGPVTRFEVPNLWALKFVLEGALSGGGPSSLRADNLGKALGGALLRLTVDVPGDWPPRARPPADPYLKATWRLPR